ncbi:MAG: IPT/TIG domain-containing protein, partial [Dehalococcoidia bacterium]|nr:IPT/TIG domain-containing protein [Dehalococcoidia bacterium]
EQNTQLTISGTGFAGYMPMNLKIGGYTFPINPITSAQGVFSATVTVPGIAPGTHVVQVNDNIDTASTFFVIKAAAPTVASALATVADELVRVWGYFAGEWQMYDPADEVGSDLDNLTPGRGYWVKVSEDCTLIYGGFSYELTAGWNNIGWR